MFVLKYNKKSMQKIYKSFMNLYDLLLYKFTKNPIFRIVVLAF